MQDPIELFWIMFMSLKRTSLDAEDCCMKLPIAITCIEKWFLIVTPWKTLRKTEIFHEKFKQIEEEATLIFGSSHVITLPFLLPRNKSGAPASYLPQSLVKQSMENLLSWYKPLLLLIWGCWTGALNEMQICYIVATKMNHNNSAIWLP